MDVVFLMTAILTCLALGVAMAYGACNLMFACLRMQPKAVEAVAQAPSKVVETAKV